MDEAGKGLGFDGLGTQVAGHIEWVADHEGAAGVSAGKAGEGVKIVALICAGERKDGLSSQPKGIRDGHADAPVAYIESHKAEWGSDWLLGVHG